MAASLNLVAALMLLSPLTRGDLPEDDFRIVDRQDLLASGSDVFTDNTTGSFSQLLFDVARDQVIVGARDAIFRLSLRGLRLLERADWPAPPDKAQLCQDKGQTEHDCHNYVKVLLAYGHKIFACGTNAFSPLCSWREMESLGTVSQWTSGVAHCPYSPHSNVTALLATNGQYYAGTTADFTGSDTAICRSRGASVHATGTLRTTQYDQSLLYEPQFVGSFEHGAYVYFVFRERAVEFLNCGTIIYSRIGRVCKNDSGGHVVMKDSWSTFLKARLECSVPGTVPFHYDEVQGIEYVPQEQLIVATFTTNVNSIAGSAVCVYNMSDVAAAFDGPFKAQESQAAAWEPRAPSTQASAHFRCQADTRTDQEMEYHRYHLMYESVRPISGEPLYRAILQRWTRVTVDVTATTAGRQLVVFVANDRGNILKLAVLPHYDGACLVELLNMADHNNGGHTIQAMQFVKDTMSLYIGSEWGVLRVPAERCERHVTRAACAGAADPHCGWDDARALCRHGPEPPEHYGCPSPDAPVDGGWSAWSEWRACAQHDTAHAQYGERPDTCQCRARRCDSPTPRRNGQPCHGASISVSNCTVHGGWSAWSEWSACSASCGIAVKSRRRACASPEPRHGGRVCVGLHHQDVYCNSLPPCPDPALAPIDGGWGPWGPWSACAGAGGPGCGADAGWHERRRSCAAPEPRNGGADCEGPTLDRQPCNLRPCETKKASAWTPWVIMQGNSSDGSYIEKRFKFVCRAQTAEQIKVSVGREESRQCVGESCSSHPHATAGEGTEAGWGEWGEWGACSAACGGGQQVRARTCRRAPCMGSAQMLRACHLHACDGEWSCWSEWSECSGACGGVGQRTRTRQCASAAGCADAAAAVERRHCRAYCADEDWGEWGEWSVWPGNGRLRRRTCLATACRDAQLQLASENSPTYELYASPIYWSSEDTETGMMVHAAAAGGVGAGALVGCVIAAFAAGCMTCLAGVVYARRRGLPWQRRTRVPSSPHYITAKQNSYVTVPLKHVPRKAKRQPSFTGIGGASGVLLSKANNLHANNQNNTATTPKLYPKAIANEYDSMGTLKRYSHHPHKNNLDAEEDKFY